MLWAKLGGRKSKREEGRTGRPDVLSTTFGSHREF